MTRGLNKAMIIGHLGRDPEFRKATTGGSIANVNLATTEVWKDRNSGERQERTEWHRIVFFGRLAEIVNDYLKKGSQIYIEGRLQTRKWQDREGNDRYTTEIVASEMQMLGARTGGGGGQGHGGSHSGGSSSSGGTAAGSSSNTGGSGSGTYSYGNSNNNDDIGNRAPAGNRSGGGGGGGGGGGNDFDDDIPF